MCADALARPVQRCPHLPPLDTPSASALCRQACASLIASFAVGVHVGTLAGATVREASGRMENARFSAAKRSSLFFAQCSSRAVPRTGARHALGRW
jgi:hypothetical protein